MESTESPQDSDAQFDAIVDQLRTWARRIERRRSLHLWEPGWRFLVLLVLVAVALLLAGAAWHVWSSTPPPRTR